MFVLHAGGVDSDVASLLAAVPEAAARVIRDAWRATMSSEALVAVSGKPRLLIEIVADLGRDVVLRWSAGPEQLLPLRLDLREAVRSVAGYLLSGPLIHAECHCHILYAPAAGLVLGHTTCA